MSTLHRIRSSDYAEFLERESFNRKPEYALTSISLVFPDAATRVRAIENACFSRWASIRDSYVRYFTIN